MQEVKTEKKSPSVEKQAGFKLHVTLVCYQLCKFVVFSILLRTQTVHLEVSFIIYSALSTPSLFFSVRFVRTFERLAKTFQFLKIIHSGYSRSHFNLFLIYAVACNACKYKPSQI